MLFVSFPKAGLKDSPAVIADLLRSKWINSGVYLVLEGVNVQTFDPEAQTTPQGTEEHILIGFEGDSSHLGEVAKLLAACQLGPPTLWQLANVYETVEQAATFYYKENQLEIAAGIYQRFADGLRDSYMAQCNAGRFFLRLERPELARPYLSRAYELAPEVPEVGINYCILLQMENNIEEAAALWEEISRKFPDHPIVQSMREEKAITEAENE